MANQKIHEYLIERFTINDDDYFDIDWLDGGVYKTAKVKGSVVKSLASAINIYNTDGTLTGDRQLTGDNFVLDLETLGQFVVHSHKNGVDGNIIFEIRTDATDHSFIIRDHNTGVHVLACRDGKVEISDNYFLPVTDGTPGQVMTTDGFGNVTFQTSPTGTNIYNSDGTLTGIRQLSGAQNPLAFNDLGLFYVDVNPPALQDWGVNINVDTSNLTPGDDGTPFRVMRAQDGQILFASVEDGRVNVNNTYFLPATNGADGEALLTNGLLQPTLAWTPVVTDQFVNFAQTQWAKTLVTPSTLANGQTANGFTFFNNITDKVTNGTTAYDEYNIAFSITLTLTGTSGTANINVGGTNYLATFTTGLALTASNFVTAHATNILLNSGVHVTNIGSTLKFGFEDVAVLNAITITNVIPNLSGTFNTAIGDHVRIPYTGQPYFGQRLSHNFRVNFGITIGSQQTVALSLRRWADNSIIGSEIPIYRNPDVSGQQENFVSYTAGALDPFVTGGFYFALRNDSGVSIDIEASIGILIITEYQKPTKF